MRVAISGHQELGEAERLEWVRGAVGAALEELRATSGVTCLAAGTDQLFGLLCLERGLPYTVIIPCRAYVGTFTAAPDLVEYHRLLEAAGERVAMDYDEPGPLAYAAANRAMVDRCDALIAVWDGKPARDPGETADVVAYAQLRGRRVIHVDLNTKETKTLGTGTTTSNVERPRRR